MSNLLKSKFLLGALVVAAMFAGVAVFSAPSAEAACSITSTLRVGSKGSQVACLQTALDNGIVADGAFGPKTKARVVAWQASMGLVADGVFGPKSLAAWLSGSTTTNLPAGCTSTSGFSPVTGVPCNSGAVTGLPVGCSSTSGFSATTGLPCNGGSTVVNNGPLGVSLASDNPASGVVVSGQATADLLHLNFSGSGTVSTITLQRTGISANTALSNVYLYQGGTRISESASVNSLGVINFTGVNFVVNGSATVSVKADIAAGLTGGTVGVTLTGFSASGSAASTANISGNVMNITAGGSGILAAVVVDQGASSPYNNVASATINAGATSYTVWSTPIQVNTHTVWLKSLALRYVGSAPNDAVQNLKLYLNGVPTGAASMVNSMGYVVFDLSAAPVLLNTGSTTIDVRGDVQKGSARTFSFALQNAADLMVTDSQLNVNVAPTTSTSGTNATFLVSQGGTITVSAGSATTVIDPSFQSQTNVTGGSSNAVIGKFKVHAYGEDVKVMSVSVTPSFSTAPTLATGTCTNATDCSLNNVALYFNGAQVGSSANWTGTGALTFQLGSSMIIPAGVDSTFEVHADIQTSGNVNYTAGVVVVTLNIGSSNAQGMNSLSSTGFPLAAISTTGLTIATGTLSVSANAAYTNQAINPNLANQKIGSFVLQNQSTSESVRVTNLKVNLAFTTVGSTNYANLRTSEQSGSGAVPINPATAIAGSNADNNFSVLFTLAPGETKIIDVFADVGANVGTVIARLTPTAIGVSSNVNVTPGSAAVGQTITVAAGTFGNAGIVTSSTVPQFIAGAGTGVIDGTKATFNFKASSGTATVSELKFLVSTTSDRSSVSSVRVGNTTAPVVGGVAYLTGLNIAVPNGGSGVNVDAFMTFGPVGTNGNTSGDESQVELVYIKSTIGGTSVTTTGGQATLASNTLLTTATSGTIAAVGSTATLNLTSTTKIQPGMKLIIDVNNGTNTDSVVVVQSVTSGTAIVAQTLFLGDSATIVSADEVYFYSIPQTRVDTSSANNCPASTALAVGGVTVAAGSTSGTDCMTIVGSKPTLGVVDVSTNLINGLVKVGQVTVAADSHGDIALNTLSLAFNSTGNVTIASNTDNIVVRNAADQTLLTTTNTNLAVTAGGSDTSSVITFTGGQPITGGTTLILDIYVTAATVTGGPSANVLSMGLDTTKANFTWTDTAGAATSAETGTLILNYPTNTSVIND